jgi:acyl-CoA synthetase (AMP-forming)/AMP-acid ligase II
MIGDSMRSRQYSLGTVVGAHARANARRPALIEGGRTISFDELERRTNRLARALLAQGVRKVERIALLLNDGIQYIEMIIAAGKVGAIAMLLNWRLSPAELTWILGEGGPVAVYRADRFAGLVADATGFADYVIADDKAGEAAYELWASQGQDGAISAGIAGDDPLFMMFTSGTTGRPKGCVHSHAATIVSAMAFAGRRGFLREDSNLSVTPLFHVAGLGQVFAALIVGGANVFVPRDSSITAPVEIAVSQGCTVSVLALPLMDACKAVDDAATASLRFRSITGGAGMGDPRKFAFVAEQWNALLVGGWGQTENWSFGTQIDYPDMLEHPTSIGWPLHHIEAAILDEAGHPIDDPEGEGEMGVRGPNVMLGYWNNPEATEAALGTGWLRTGDLVMRDQFGLFHLRGRLKELIKSGGENVYPAEVENVIKALPGVADAAVAGVKDRTWGEAVKAFVVLRPGAALTAEAITQACREQIAGYKRPRYLEFVDVIPRDHFGKIQRQQLSARGATPDQATA